MNRLTSTYDRFNAPSNIFSSTLLMSSAEDVNKVLEKELPKLKQPGMVFLNYIDAHDPYYPDEAFYDVKAESYLDVFYSDVRSRPLPNWMVYPRTIRDKKKREDVQGRVKNTPGRLHWPLADNLSEAQLERYRARYKGELKYLDYHVGRLMEILKKNGFYDDTVIFITADHGESFGEAGYITHWFSNKGDKESTRHVPLVVLPEHKDLEAGVVLEDETSIADIAPTIYDILGIDYAALKTQQEENLGRSFLGRMSEHFAPRRSSYEMIPKAPPPEAEDAKKKRVKREGTIESSASSNAREAGTRQGAEKAPASELQEPAPDESEREKTEDDEMMESLKALGYISE
jgi:arylsulfatase A-like enzyme